MEPLQQSYSDQPTTHDELGFAPSTQALVQIINGLSLADTPLTIGIFGPWGSGKTSQMQMILDRLDTMRYIPIWFEAWRYAQSDTLWRALLLSVVEEIRSYVLSDDERLKTIIERRHRINPTQHSNATTPEAIAAEREQCNTRLDDMIGSLYRNVEREELGGLEVNWGEAGKVAVRTALRLGFSSLPLLGVLTTALEKAADKAQEKIGEAEDAAALFDIFQRTRSQIYRDQVRSLEQFYQSLKALIKEWVIDTDLRLVVFIDDLDRCLPEQAIGVLEALKVFLDIQGCLFVLGVDRAVIERGIRVRYKEFALADDPTMREGSDAFPIAGRDYLDKIVQVPFEMLPLEDSTIEAFVCQRLQLQEGLNEDDIRAVAYFTSIGLEPNPRKVKRTLNTFRLLLELGKAYGHTFPAALLAKLVVIQSSFPHVYEYVLQEPNALNLLEQVAHGHVQMEKANDIQKLCCALFPESYDYVTRMSEASSAGGIILPNWTDILKHAAPRLQAMLQGATFFGSLKEHELRDLVFVSRRTV